MISRREFLGSVATMTAVAAPARYAPHQLFDLQEDPEEVTNLAARRPDLARKLEGEVRRICSPERENARAEDYIARAR